jgi:hypothetical protein
MRLASRIAWEGVEDAERRGSKADREPGGGLRLLLDNRETAAKEALDGRFLAGFRFQSNE